MTDYAVWPDKTVCEVSELSQMLWKSDDYVILSAENEESALTQYNQLGGIAHDSE